MEIAALVIAIQLASADAVPGRTLDAAEGIATGILKSAGVRPVWRNCEGGKCADAGGAPAFPLQLVGSVPRGLRGNATGYAVVYPAPDFGGYSVVSYTAAERSAESCGRPASLVLGAAMAHEIGHLLLGGQSHAAIGIMVPRLDCEKLTRASRGELGFTPDQARRIGARWRKAGRR